MPIQTHAKLVFRRPPHRLNCAQAVLDAYQTVTGHSVAPVADFKPFGGGRAAGGECGALYAACQAAPSSAAAIRAAFAARTGTTLCRELDALPCEECVALAARLLAQLHSDVRTAPSSPTPTKP
ncbi:MAG TPA: hypothetical protein PK322_00125 [Opitutaceae bacterium]|nr:hypothetical protein [Opitutaceae bacterium]